MELDGDLRAVTPAPGDAEAVTERVRACEREDGGSAERTLEDTPPAAAPAVPDGYEHAGMTPRGTHLHLGRRLR
jgi:hypothetical protein